MRPIGPRFAAASATLLTMLGLSVGTANGDGVVETVYVTPVSYYVPTRYVAPTSYVVPTSYVTTGSSYVVPTTYVAPTSYVTTGSSYLVPTRYVTTGSSYVVPTSYVATSASYVPTSYVATSASYVPTSLAVAPAYTTTTYYRRPGLLRRLASRPVIETTYRYATDLYPTTIYQPTTISYEPSVVTTSLSYANPCGETSVPFDPPPASNDATATSRSIESRPKETNGEQVYDDAATKKAAADASAKAKAKPIPPVDSPLDGPAPEKEPPAAGGLSEPSNEPPPKGTADPSLDRTSFRKTMKDVQPRAAGTTSSQGMLRGEVVSGTTRDPKPNLQVVFTDLRGRFPDRSKTTDAKGTFEIFLPDGGWSYRVVDPTAAAGIKPREYDGQVIATSGRYLDETDAPLYGLRLNY